MLSVAELLEKWEAEAVTMERYADVRGAAVCRLHVAELRDAIGVEQDQVLTLAEAALEGGYPEDHIRHMIGDGRLRNAGVKGAPRIRRADVPRRPNGRPRAGADPEAAAADILRRSA